MSASNTPKPATSLATDPLQGDVRHRGAPFLVTPGGPACFASLLDWAHKIVFAPVNYSVPTATQQPHPPAAITGSVLHTESPVSKDCREARDRCQVPNREPVPTVVPKSVRNSRAA